MVSSSDLLHHCANHINVVPLVTLIDLKLYIKCGCRVMGQMMKTANMDYSFKPPKGAQWPFPPFNNTIGEVTNI